MKRLKVVVVGGAGAMGRYAVRGLRRLDTAEEVLVADLDADRARRVAEEVGDPARPVRLDATDPAAMRRVFADCDVVLNCMGPFARFGLPVLEAALDAGCDYLDIDDDWQSTRAALDLDERARGLGRRVVIGLGASPGTTNLCAKLAASHLDSVSEIYTGWSLASASVEPEPTLDTHQPSAAIQHWVHQCSADLRAWDRGGPATVPAVEEVALDFPGIGPARGYTMGHPEPITLPITYPDLQRSLNLQCGPPELFTQFRAVLDELGAGMISFDQAVQRVASGLAAKGDADYVRLPELWALVSGSKDGKPATVAAHPRRGLPGRMGGNTGTPLAIGAELLRRGLITGVGVRAPEAAIDPVDFFALYRRFRADYVDGGEGDRADPNNLEDVVTIVKA